MATTTQTWTSNQATSGNRFDWFNAANWTTGVVPDATTDALFPVTGNGAYEVSGSSTAGPIIAMDVTVNDPNFDLYIGGAASARPTASVSVLNTFVMNAGTITLDDGGFQVGGGGTIDGTLTLGTGAVLVGDGLLSGGGGVEVLDTTASTTGDLQFAGGTIIAQALGAQTGLEIVSAVSGAGNFQIAGDASLLLDDTVDSSSTVSFTGGSGATGSIVENYAANLLGDTPANLSINVAGMDVGSGTGALDTIDIAGAPGATASLAGNVITVANAGGGGTDSFTLIGNYTNDLVQTSSDGAGGTFVYLDSVCFLSGTRIQTAEGDRAVETLRSGDLVTVVRNGVPELQPIK